MRNWRRKPWRRSRPTALPQGTITFRRTVDMRYVGQFHEVEADMANGKVTQEHIAATVAFFGRRHEELYTFSMP